MIELLGSIFLARLYVYGVLALVIGLAIALALVDDSRRRQADKADELKSRLSACESQKANLILGSDDFRERSEAWSKRLSEANGAIDRLRASRADLEQHYHQKDSVIHSLKLERNQANSRAAHLEVQIATLEGQAKEYRYRVNRSIHYWDRFLGKQDRMATSKVFKFAELMERFIHHEDLSDNDKEFLNNL